MKPGKKADQPCPMCGGESYSWGSLRAHGGFNFVSDGTSLLVKLFGGGTELPARRCNECGNVQIFTATWVK